MVYRYSAIDRDLTWVLVHLFHHKLGGTIPFESRRIWVALCERGLRYLGRIVAGRIVPQRLLRQVLRSEYTLPI